MVLLKNNCDSCSGKTATQSSVGWGGLPGRGVDGRISGTWNKGTCTHSQNAGANWWAVDLESNHEVDSVVIYNRMDCCQNRLNGAKVRYRDQCRNKTNLASKWSRCRSTYIFSLNFRCRCHCSTDRCTPTYHALVSIPKFWWEHLPFTLWFGCSKRQVLIAKIIPSRFALNQNSIKKK